MSHSGGLWYICRESIIGPDKKCKIMMDLLGWAIAACLVILSVGIHYETIRFVSDVLVPWAFRRFHSRRIMMALVTTLLLGHIAEIWLFALAMGCMSFYPPLGHLTGDIENEPGVAAFLYFSATNYTSLGYGDVAPRGPLRNIAVSEALAGLLMIAWSASFIYIKMEQVWSWRRRTRHRRKSDPQ